MKLRVMGHRAVWPTVIVLGFGAATACTSGGPATPTSTPTLPGTSESESTSPPVAPSISREVPPERRQRLAEVEPKQLCELVTPEELSRLAFPVEPGHAREIGFDPPVRGCTFDATTGVRSVLIAAQPAGLGQAGRDEVELGSVGGTQTLHVNDCTVFADVPGATLQVAVTASEADTVQCQTAQGVAQYVLAGLVHP